MSTRMEWEPGFEEKAWHYRSSLNPLGDAVREATDEIHARVRGAVDAELGRWQSQADSTAGLAKKGHPSDRLRFFRSKAMAYSLRRYRDLLRPIMVHDGEENYGAVVAFHAAGDLIEYGGRDSRIQLGRTDEHLVYPAFGFLRRGLR